MSMIGGGMIGSTGFGNQSGGSSGGFVNPSGVSLAFTQANGTSFTLEHNLGTDRFAWQMWNTDLPQDRAVIPENVRSAGPNHIAVELDSPMAGYINLVLI